MHDEVLFYRSKIKVFRLGFFGLLLLLPSIILFIVEITSETSILKILFLSFCIIFFGSIELFLIKQLFSPNPILIINKSGFKDNSSLMKSGFVSWDKVKDIYIYRQSLFFANKQDYIAIDLYDYNAFIKTRRGVSKFLFKINRLFYKSAFFITNGTFKEKFETIFETMENYYKAFSKGEQNDNTTCNNQ